MERKYSVKILSREILKDCLANCLYLACSNDFIFNSLANLGTKSLILLRALKPDFAG